MSDLVIETPVCHECYAVLDATDHYCRQCGMTTAHSAGLSNGDTGAASFRGKPACAPSVRQPKWSESPWVVLPLLFLILGPFALPLLWRSRRFTRVWKIILTVIMLGLTAYLLWCVWFAVHQTLASLRELDNVRGF